MACSINTATLPARPNPVLPLPQPLAQPNAAFHSEQGAEAAAPEPAATFSVHSWAEEKLAMQLPCPISPATVDP